MTTDNWPVDFRYISHRLVREIVQQHLAGRSGPAVQVKPGLKTPFGSLDANFEGEKIDWDNWVQLARIATHAVVDHTHRLDDLNPLRSGDYLRCQLGFQEHVVEPLGVPPIATYVAFERVLGRAVFVGLAGSPQNLPGWGEPVRYAGRVPSDAHGLYDLIDATREQGDDLVDDGLMRIQEGYRSDLEARLQAIASFFGGSALWKRVEPLEALVRVHDVADEVSGLYVRGPDDIVLESVDRVVVGAPVWVRTIEPKEFQPIAPIEVPVFSRLPDGDELPGGLLNHVPARRTDRYELLDETLLEPGPRWADFDLDVVTYHEVSTGGDSEAQLVVTGFGPNRWAQLGRWFVAQAAQSTAHLLTLEGRDEERWWRRLFGPPRRRHAPGWFVPEVGHGRQSRREFSSGFLVDVEGEIWRGMSTGDVLDEASISCTDPQVLSAYASLLRAVAEMKAPMWRGHLESDPTIDPSTKVVRRRR